MKKFLRILALFIPFATSSLHSCSTQLLHATTTTTTTTTTCPAQIPLPQTPLQQTLITIESLLPIFTRPASMDDEAIEITRVKLTNFVMHYQEVCLENKNLTTHPFNQRTAPKQLKSLQILSLFAENTFETVYETLRMLYNIDREIFYEDMPIKNPQNVRIANAKAFDNLESTIITSLVYLERIIKQDPRRALPHPLGYTLYLSSLLCFCHNILHESSDNALTAHVIKMLFPFIAQNYTILSHENIMSDEILTAYIDNCLIMDHQSHRFMHDPYRFAEFWMQYVNNWPKKHAVLFESTCISTIKAKTLFFVFYNAIAHFFIDKSFLLHPAAEELQEIAFKINQYKEGL